MLHIACRSADADPTVIFGSSAFVAVTIYLLLKLKVDTNAVNIVGDDPLHIFGVVREDVDARDAMASPLVMSGAHLDMLNKQGMTPADL